MCLQIALETNVLSFLYAGFQNNLITSTPGVKLSQNSGNLGSVKNVMAL